MLASATPRGLLSTPSPWEATELEEQEMKVKREGDARSVGRDTGPSSKAPQPGGPCGSQVRWPPGDWMAASQGPHPVWGNRVFKVKAEPPRVPEPLLAPEHHPAGPQGSQRAPATATPNNSDPPGTPFRGWRQAAARLWGRFPGSPGIDCKTLPGVAR